MKASDGSALGATPLRVSALGVGAGSQSMDAGWDGVIDTLDAAWAAGLRYFDTAPLYASGDSERVLGEFLSGRSDYVVSTKVGRFPGEGNDRVFDYSAAATEASITDSLNRLGLQRIGVVIIHDLDRELQGSEFDPRFEQAVSECYPTLARLRGDGLIGAIGLSSRQPDVCLSFMDAHELDCVMMAGSYTLLNHAPLADLLPRCLERGVSVLIASPFNSGILATSSPNSLFDYGTPSPSILTRVAQLGRVCAEFDVALADAALQFPLLHAAVSSVVAGNRDPKELRRNIAGVATELPTEFWDRLKELQLIPGSAPTTARTADDHA